MDQDRKTYMYNDEFTSEDSGGSEGAENLADPNLNRYYRRVRTRSCRNVALGCDGYSGALNVER